MREKDREREKMIEKKQAESSSILKLLKQGLQTTNQNYHLALDYSHTYLTHMDK